MNLPYEPNPTTRELTAHWTRHQPIVRLFIRNMVRDRDHAEDLVQETAMTLVDKFGEFDRSQNFKSWALGIARNKVLNYYRTTRRDRHVFDEDVLTAIAEAHERAEDSMEERRDALRLCLRKLSDDDRIMVESQYDHDESSAVLADRLGMSVGAVYMRMHRIRRALLECIEGRVGGARE